MEADGARGRKREEWLLFLKCPMKDKDEMQWKLRKFEKRGLENGCEIDTEWAINEELNDFEDQKRIVHPPWQLRGPISSKIKLLLDDTIESPIYHIIS